MKVKEHIKNNYGVYCLVLIFLLYLLPTFVQVELDNDLHITRFYMGLPSVLSGDEPHYFVTTTSLINDHDYYVDNNYDNAYYKGGCDVSFHYVNNTNPTIGRHIQLVDPEKKIIISMDTNRTYEGKEEEMYQTYNVTQLRQVSNRPIGLPFFSALFLWPLKDTCLIEHGAIYLSVIISYIGVIFFYLIAIYYAKKYVNENPGYNPTVVAMAFTVIFALCTQYWHYSKTYFTEPYLASFLLIAYYLFFIKEQNVLPGFILALGCSMKYPFGMYLALFGICLIIQRFWKRILLFIAGSIIPLAGILYYNWLLSSHPFALGRTEYLAFGNYFFGIFQWLFNPIFGLIPAAPFLLFSIYGIYALYKLDKKTSIIFCLLIGPNLLVWGSYILTQTGAGGYSARYLIPLISFLVLLCMMGYIKNRSNFLKYVFWLFIVLSFCINVQAAFLYPLFWNNPPWVLIDFFIQKIDRIQEIVIHSIQL